MKKLLLTLCALATAMAGMGATYEVDFNTPIDTSDPAFKVAPGWKHLVDKGTYAYEKVTYTYLADGGEEGEGDGALQIGSQTYQNPWTPTDYTFYDLLVTPAVGGDITIDVKKVNTAGYIEFYKVTEENGTLVRGEQIPVSNEDLVSLFFTTLTIPAVEEGTMIGIRGNDVYIDNFTAQSANVQLQTALSFASYSADKTGKIDCNSENKFEISGKVTLKNTGETTVTPGMATFSLVMMKQDESGNYVADKTVGTYDLDETLEPGVTSAEINFSTLVDETEIEAIDGVKSRRYDLTCNLSATSVIFSNFTPVPYIAIPSYSIVTNSDLQHGNTIDFGIVTGSGSMDLTVLNDGAAPMIIESVDVEGEGFSAELAANTTIEKHTSLDIPITISSEITGEKTGTITINATGLDPVTFQLHATVLDPSLWYVNFEDGKMPANMIAAEGWKVENTLSISPNLYYANNANTQVTTKLISPLLTFEEGDILNFEAARNYGTSTLNVYYSTDRKDWTLVRSLSADAEDPADLLSSEYSGFAWGSSTQYIFTPFRVENLPAGNLYIAFEAGNARIDNILGGKPVAVEHDLYISDMAVPTSAMVNNPATISVSVKNLTDASEEADTYTVGLYNGEKLLAVAETIEIAPYEVADFEFSFTPHEAGELQLTVAIKGENFSIESDTYLLNVSEELSTSTIQVGDNSKTNSSDKYSAPIATYNENSQSETVYTAEMLGIEPGTMITSVVFKGSSTSAKTIDIDLKVWIENTTDETPQNILLTDGYTDGMTNVYNGNYKFAVTTSLSDMLVIEFPQPFEYTGGNLRVVLSHSSSSWATTYFELDYGNKTQSIYRQGTSLPGYFTASQLPVAYFTVSVAPHVVSGVVSDQEGNNVAKANVSLKNGDVLYSTVTDQNGKYTLNVHQHTLNYTVIVDAEGYKSHNEENFTIDSPVTQKDIILEADKEMGIAVVNPEMENNVYYDLNGLRLKSKPEKGFYILNGKVYKAQ